jgi:hypothetical protein
MLKDVLSYGLGTLVALAIVGVLVFLFVRDITQKKHSVSVALNMLYPYPEPKAKMKVA